MSAKNMAERSVEKRLVEGVEALGGVTMKLEVPGSRFWPDRLLIGPNGQVVFVELKTDAGRLSRGQEARIAQLRALNHMVAVLHGADAVDHFIETLTFAWGRIK